MALYAPLDAEESEKVGVTCWAGWICCWSGEECGDPLDKETSDDAE